MRQSQVGEGCYLDVVAGGNGFKGAGRSEIQGMWIGRHRLDGAGEVVTSADGYGVGRLGVDVEEHEYASSGPGPDPETFVVGPPIWTDGSCKLGHGDVADLGGLAPVRAEHLSRAVCEQGGEEVVSVGSEAWRRLHPPCRHD